MSSGGCRPKSVLSSFLILVNIGQCHEKEGYLWIILLSGHLDGGLWESHPSNAVLNLEYVHTCNMLSAWLLLLDSGRGAEERPYIVLLPGVDDFWLRLLNLLWRGCSGSWNSHRFQQVSELSLIVSLVCTAVW